MSRTVARELTVYNGAHAIRARIDGRATGPTVLLANGLGLNLEMWAAQMPQLGRLFRVVRFDNRGHGGSAVPDGPMTMETVASDALAVLDAVGAERASVIGLSMGGMLALWLAAHHPDRVDKVVAANLGGASNAQMWNARIKAVTDNGIAAVSEGMAERWFTAPFLAASPERAQPVLDQLAATSAEGYAAGCAAVRDADIHAVLGSITAPTLVIAGLKDAVTAPALGGKIAAAIAGAQFVELDAGHLSNVEAADAFTHAAIAFLVRGGMAAEADRYDLGMSVRRQVLGDAWVDGTLERRNAFNAEFQEYITRYAWGEVWTRPGLEPFTRSFITLSICIALGRWDEFRLHTQAAFNNGLGKDEIKELLIQAAVYAGVPAANTAFHHASQVFEEMGI